MLTESNRFKTLKACHQRLISLLDRSVLLLHLIELTLKLLFGGSRAIKFAELEHKACASCHGQQGEGNVALNAPKLSGQQPWYIERQLNYFKQGIRGGEGDTYGQQMTAFASMLADARGARGLVCLGYPFHPPGKPERLRVHHLAKLETPSLFVQGERDTFGTREEIDGYELSERISFAWMPDGDHSFKPRKSSGTTNAENLQRAVVAVDGFLKGLLDN